MHICGRNHCNLPPQFRCLVMVWALTTTNSHSVTAVPCLEPNGDHRAIEFDPGGMFDVKRGFFMQSLD